MEKEEKQKIRMGEALRNNWYAIRMGFEISKSRVIHSFVVNLFGNFEWVFFSGYFLRHIVGELEAGKDFSTIFMFILGCGGMFFVMNLYNSYVENVVVPLEGTRVYQGIYEKLYRKAKNVELRCYEDSDFYNKYTMAADQAEEKVTKIIDSTWGIVTGVFASGAVLYTMFTIDPVSVLFVISPLVGNFLFGNLKNRFEFM